MIPAQPISSLTQLSFRVRVRFEDARNQSHDRQDGDEAERDDAGFEALEASPGSSELAAALAFFAGQRQLAAERGFRRFRGLGCRSVQAGPNRL
jgi:hypothetical protein